ncbi:MAG: RNA polymerase sigma factor [Chloroflexota bacterium]
MTPSGDRDVASTKADQVAFELCFRDHYADVLAFALRRLPERQTAEDVVAETFAVVWRRPERIPDPALPWLYAIAVRVIANQRRSAHRRSNLAQRLAHEAGAATPGRDPSEALHLRSSFASAFGRLNESEREVLCLIAWDGLSPREAAAVLGCSYGAFRVRFHRAKRKLKKHLAASGHLPDEHRPVFSDPAAEEIN